MVLILKLPAQEAPTQKVDPFQLALVLKSARQYCQRLEKAALDIVCQEEVSEFIDLTRYNAPNLVSQVPSVTSVSGGWTERHRAELRLDTPPTGKSDNTYLFDYQFVRKAGEVKENRVLLEKNRKKPGKTDEPPKTETFQYADVLLMPVRLLDERFGAYYDYRLLREDELNGTKAWVLEVVPRPSSTSISAAGSGSRRRTRASSGSTGTRRPSAATRSSNSGQRNSKPSPRSRPTPSSVSKRTACGSRASI